MRVINIQILILFFSMMMGVGGCGGSGGGNTDDEVDVGTGSGDATADTMTTITSTADIAALGRSRFFAEDAGLYKASHLIKADIIDETDDCETEGTVSFQGDITFEDTEGSYDITLELDNCDGFNGTFVIAGTYFFEEDQDNYYESFDGDIGGNGCLLTYDNLTIDTVVTDEDYTSILNGSISSVCGDETISCSWEDVNLYDVEAVEAGCE